MKQKNLETWWAATGVRESAHDPATREQCKEIKLSLFFVGIRFFFSREYFNCIPAQPWLLKKSKIHYDIEIYYDIDHTPQ